jgi:enamine deaminase RidA (YjgF/YER057c/UK114 family)
VCVCVCVCVWCSDIGECTYLIDSIKVTLIVRQEIEANAAIDDVWMRNGSDHGGRRAVIRVRLWERQFDVEDAQLIRCILYSTWHVGMPYIMMQHACMHAVDASRL